MATVTAQYRCSPDAGPGAHVDLRRSVRPRFSKHLYRRLRAPACLHHGGDRWLTEGYGLGLPHHPDSGTDNCHAGATDEFSSDHDRCELVGPARRSRRTAVLDGYCARCDAGPDWASGRRFWVWLWSDRRHRQSAPEGATTAIADRSQSCADIYPNGTVQRYAAQSWGHL